MEQAEIEILNLNPLVFRITTSDGPPEWYKYFLCGVKGAEELFVDSAATALRGMMVLVSGDIPPASGLSSSSALVSAAILLACYANQLSVDKLRLATAAAKCERYIGTCGGGMDQAIAFLAERGTAQYIQWNPLKATTIQMPQNAFFVIANSLSEANKAATPDFNQRVIECQLGCRLMAKKASLNWREVGKFALLQKTLNFTLNEMLELAKGCLVKDCYSRRDLLDEFAITEEELDEKLLTPNTRQIPVLYIRQRALHVFQEAQRVDRFRGAAEEGDLEEMSLLMRDSHRSLAELYECSHKNLDALVRIAEGVGVVGCRLTGAGWGGCVVALCHSIEKGEELIAELKEKYYSKFPQQSLSNVVFMTHPGGGAEVFLK